jgi:nucleoside-diphosphate-sugar epimerase
MPMQPRDVPEGFADIDKSGKLLSYKPTTNEDAGIRKFLKVYKIIK